MKLSDYLDDELIIEDLDSSSKPGVLEELVTALGATHPEIDRSNAKKVLMEREQLGTTGIGEGVAIPHGKLPGLEQVILVVGRSLGGVDFDALDFKPCSIFFLVLAPEQAAGIHLRILAHISRLLKDEGFRKSFMEAPDKQALQKLLSTA